MNNATTAAVVEPGHGAAPSATQTSDLASHVVKAYVGISIAVLLLMMLVGGLMKLSQAQWIPIDPAWFYKLMTAHGAGMVGIAGLAASGVMWYYLSRYVRLSTGVLILNLALFLAGVVFILGAIFVGDFAAAWTFLFPLPAQSGGVWGTYAAASFMTGLLLIGVGFLVLFLDVARAILSRYGNLSNALGWPHLFRNQPVDPDLPPAVIASTMVLVINILSILAGAVVLVICLVNLFVPDFALDALFVKNLIFFFGHVFINATIYMSVIAVYEILPEYTGRKWKVSRWFLGAWTASLIMVLIVYPHHLLMDFALPRWMHVVGQIISYTSGIPVLVVTAFGALTLLYRSGIRWDLPSKLLVLAVFGWAAGAIPAIADGTIRINLVMHNTLWVPGHFHFYLLLGLFPMIMAFALHAGRHIRDKTQNLCDRVSFGGFVAGGLIFVFAFLLAGQNSVPRRFAVHLDHWLAYDQLGSLGALLALVAVLIFAVRSLGALASIRV